MDIARYIGLFLLKNSFCYIPGLGNIEIKKTSATHDGTALKAPAHEIVITPGGSIDDSLANFIATNEKISIASASNGIRDFVTASKAKLNAGEEVAIPSLGLLSQAGGRLHFITDPAFKFTPAPIPTITHAPRSMEDVKTTASSGSTYIKQKQGGGLSKTVIIGIVAGLVVGATAAGVVYMRNNNPEPVAEEVVVGVQEPVTPAVDTTATDTAAITDSSAINTSATTSAATPGQYKVILNTYDTRAKAERRTNKLASFGNTVEMIAQDSTTFHVVMPIKMADAESARILDSLRRTFNPQGVSIYR